MKKRKNVLWLKCILLFCLCLFFGILFLNKSKPEFNASSYSEKYISVYEVKNEMAFFVYTEEEMNDFFSMYPENYLTYEMVYGLLEKMGVAEFVEVDRKTGQSAVSRESWNKIYIQVVDYLDIEQKVERDAILVLDWMEAEKNSVLFTNHGDLYTPLPVSMFSQWKAYEIYLLDGKCIGIASVSKDECRIENAYLKQMKESGLIFLFDGGEYELNTGKLGDGMTAGVCDFTIKNEKLVKISRKQDSICGNLLSYDTDYIEIEGYGKIKHKKELPVYQTFGEISEKSISDVVLGNMEVEYVVGTEEVCALLLREPAEIAKVRVLLLAENGAKFRQNVWMWCSENMVLSYGNSEESIPAGTVICAGNYGQNPELTLKMCPETEAGMFYFCNENGDDISYGYSGTMEIRWYGSGYTVVNDVSIETYLYSVVPSEMPSSYQMEALKAQAVCARSYACMQILRADLAEYGAHIDDSTSYQVYNKVPKSEEAVAAVDATCGLVMTYCGNVIEAYYFSTSMGYTDTAEIWNIEDTSSYGYLKKVCLNKEEYSGNLSEEAAFKDYLHTDVSGYDSNIKFYRWQAQADYSGKTDEIKEILKGRRQAAWQNILFYEMDGKTLVDNCDDFGKLKTISVLKRSSSGAILSLWLSFEKGCAEVKSEYNIRRVLGSGLKRIIFADGSERTDLTMLPSAYTTVEAQGDGNYLLDGGGYGHGIGMSQNGANGLAAEGFTYDEILQFFYNEIHIETMKMRKETEEMVTSE